MTLKNTVVPYVVPETQRRANSRAKAQRDAWRRRYAAVSDAIRATKSDRRFGEFTNDYQLQVQLDALRDAARALMQVRGMIGQNLRETSYTYASRELVEDAKRIRLWG